MRLILCGIIVFGCGYLGFSYAARFAQRMNQLREAEGVLARLTFHIGFLAMPFASALRLAANQPGAVCRLFDTAGKLLQEDPGRSPSEAFAAAVQRCGRGLCLEKPEMDALRELMDYAGRGDQERMQDNIRFTQAKLSLELEDAQMQYRRDGKLCRGLGVLSGMLIVILLL